MKTKNNGSASLFIYKSMRKNSKRKLINIYALIPKKGYSVNAYHIEAQFINALEKSIYYFNKYGNKLIFSACTTTTKKSCFENIYKDTYNTTENIRFYFPKKEVYSIESFIKELYNIFFLLYPDNNLNLEEISQKSVDLRYHINNYYNNLKGVKND